MESKLRMERIKKLKIDDIWIDFSESQKVDDIQAEKNAKKVKEWLKIVKNYGLIEEKKTNIKDYIDTLGASDSEMVIVIPKKKHNYLSYLYYLILLIAMVIQYTGTATIVFKYFTNLF